MPLPAGLAAAVEASAQVEVGARGQVEVAVRREISEGAIVKQSYDIDDLDNAFENLEFPTMSRSTWASIESGVLKK